jgi:hypothetical protein
LYRYKATLFPIAEVGLSIKIYKIYSLKSTVDTDDDEDLDGCGDEEHYDTEAKMYAVSGLLNWEGRMY